jgi:hypothetical protein
MDNKPKKLICKHQTGSFFETIEAIHERQVIDGKLDRDSFNNEYGNGLGHHYVCANCGKKWWWTLNPRAKWLKELFENAYTENRDENGNFI